MDHFVSKRFLHLCRTDNKDWDVKTELALEKVGDVENKGKGDPDMGRNCALHPRVSPLIWPDIVLHISIFYSLFLYLWRVNRFPIKLERLDYAFQ